ncbi:MAG TPA: transposase [Candidatus Paceibacterota bacterium]|nr:transposase [Candidatus Paceibacterota bacterium]
MSIRKTSFVQGEYYHIYNRGNSKQKIFHDKFDYIRFINLLYISNTKENFNLFDLNRVSNFNIYETDRKNNLVSIGAYCLMPNHFHILITQTEEKGISKFMQKLTTAYSMYYNKKYERTGGLFEGKFKSEHANNDRYLKYLFSYIHLNPIKLIQKDWKEKGIKDKKKSIEYLNGYQYSSFIDYLGINRIQNKILNQKSFPNYFSTKGKFIKEIFEWLSALGKT